MTWLALAVPSIVRNACSTLALRSPFGPFFLGACRYAHLMEAFLQGVQGSMPSHLTLRFLQQSQARLSDAFDADDPGLPRDVLWGSDVVACSCCCVSSSILLN